jgi:hypothetical protein
MAKKKDNNLPKIVIPLVIIFIIAAGIFFFLKLSEQQKLSKINSFEECKAAGFPIIESYPPQCRANNKTFSQDIGNELEYSDQILVSVPRPNQKVTSPITVEGKARGTWFFEGTMKAALYDSANKHLADITLTARDEWMTENFVPFSSRLEIPKTFSGEAKLLLHKDNPSGEARNDDQLEIPIVVTQ